MRKSHTFDNTVNPPNVVIIGVPLPEHPMEEIEAHLNELQELVNTAGMKVVKRVVQKLTQPDAKTMIGKGKVEEVRVYVKEHAVNYVIFDDELTPVQARNLEKTWKCKVWDRSLLILRVFSMHAQTVQAKTQVELARYEYILPRLVGMWTHHSRQKGGIGMKGAGEKELETDKRIIKEKMKFLKQKLLQMEQVSKTQRKQRKEKINVALVGYTNVGKSLLMQRLSKASVLVQDQLFATLSPTVRKIVLEDIPFLLTDTVGFIRKLPHTLIECFKSTLSEVKEADILLHIVDFSHPEYQHHIDIVLQVLKEIGATHIPMILVLNKQDRVKVQEETNLPIDESDEQNVFCAAERQRLELVYNVPTLCCSARDGVNMPALRKLLHKEISCLYEQRK